MTTPTVAQASLLAAMLLSPGRRLMRLPGGLWGIEGERNERAYEATVMVLVNRGWIRPACGLRVDTVTKEWWRHWYELTEAGRFAVLPFVSEAALAQLEPVADTAMRI